MGQQFTIGEVARMLDINREALRFYERAGLVVPERLQNGYRRYTVDDVRLLIDILAFRYVGRPIEEIKRFLFKNSFDANEEFFESWIVEEKAEQKRRQQILKTYVEAVATYERIKRSINIFSIEALPALQKIEQKELRENKDLLQFMVTVHHYRFVEDEMALLDASVYVPTAARHLMKKDDTRKTRRNKDGLRESKAELTFPQCVYTVVPSEGLTIDHKTAHDAYQWGRDKGYTIGDTVYCYYNVRAAGVYYNEVYLPIDKTGDCPLSYSLSP